MVALKFVPCKVFKASLLLHWGAMTFSKITLSIMTFRMPSIMTMSTNALGEEKGSQSLSLVKSFKLMYPYIGGGAQHSA
jgi:hypothetical protein